MGLTERTTLVSSKNADDIERGPGRPSHWFTTHQDELLGTKSLGPTLDLACGRGRHSLAAAALGLETIALDRNAESLAELATQVDSPGRLETRTLDLEGDEAPDLGTACFGAVLVFRYLHRPLFPWIESLLAPGGVLLYETFTTAQRPLGWGPSRDDFLFQPGELATSFPALETERYEEGLSKDPRAAQTARLFARKPR